MTQKIRVLIPAKPICPLCGHMGINLAFTPVPDGTTTILTNWQWIDDNGHQWMAGIEDGWAPTNQMDSLDIEAVVVDQPVLGKGSTTAAPTGEQVPNHHDHSNHQQQVDQPAADTE